MAAPPDPEPTGTDLAVPTALSPFRQPVFRAVWMASTLSNLGGMIQSVGASWTMILLAAPADMVALVQASVTLPVMLLSLLAGAIADNMDRRKVLLAAQGFMFLASMSLAVFAWTGLLTPWTLLLFTFLIGCGGAFNAPAWQASVGDMVPRSELPGAVALNSMGFNMARSVGPAIGGAIVAAAGAATAFAINACSYIALLVVLARWRPAAAVQLLPREALGTAIAAGIRYVSMSPAIRTVLVRGACYGVGGIAVLALMPLVADSLIGGGPLTYGLLLGAFGVGAVFGAMGTARLRRRFTTEALVRGVTVAFALALAVVGLSRSLPLTMAALMVTGAGWVMTLSTFNVAVQMSAPRWVLARAMSLYQMATFGGLAAGSWIWGTVAETRSVDTALFIAAAVTVASALLGRWWPLAQAAQLNLDPLRTWTEPSTEVPVSAQTGPVVINLEWVIREEDVLPFLAAMAERRRVRLRDGALHWRLLRDLSDPTRWIERYETPTWLDYVRHNNRLTQDDAVVPERLRALHQGSEAPRVRRMIEQEPASLPDGHRQTPAETPTDGGIGDP